MAFLPWNRVVALVSTPLATITEVVFAVAHFTGEPAQWPPSSPITGVWPGPARREQEIWAGLFPA